MELLIEKSDKFDIRIGDIIIFCVPHYSCLKKINNIKDIFKLLIFNDEFFNIYNLNSEQLNSIYLYVTNKIMFEKLNINSKDILLLNQIDNYYRKYKNLPGNGEFNIEIKCNKFNFFKVLLLNLKNITIKNDDITFNEFYDLLEGLNLKKYDDAGIKIKIKECSRPITLSRLFTIVLIIKSDANKIKTMNLSPLEKIIYAYDIVKKRPYKENDEEPLNARDLDRVILGNDIVCVGYSKYYNALLSFFNIPSIMIVSNEKKHALSLTYIKDDKYNIDGFLAFDITNDSWVVEDSNYIDKYNHFAISLTDLFKQYPIERLKEVVALLDTLIKEVSTFSSFSYKLLDTLEVLFKMCKEDDYKVIVRYIQNYELLSDKKRKELKKEYELLMDRLLNTSINIGTFTGALYNTRRVEYYIGLIPEINISDIRNSSANWSLNHYIDKTCEKNGKAKFVSFLCINDFLKQSEEYFISSSIKDNPSIEKDGYNMRLLRVLKREIKRKTK